MMILKGILSLLICLVAAASLTQAKVKDPIDLNRMVLIKGTNFVMGNASSAVITNRWIFSVDEKAVNTNCPGFLISKYEVTLYEFSKFVNETHYKPLSDVNGAVPIHKGLQISDKKVNWRYPGFSQDIYQPVTCVSFNDALEYCNWRSKKDGYTPCYSFEGENHTFNSKADGYRLPSELEWEFAARSGARGYIYSWGDREPLVGSFKMANIMDESAMRKLKSEYGWKGYDDGFVYTSPVGEFQPNEFGVCDMTGNVWEWCYSYFDNDKSHRVVRGGSYFLNHATGLDSLKATVRMGLTPITVQSDVGFRVVRSIFQSE